MTDDKNAKLFKRIGERIQYVRDINHMTMEELSDQSGLSISQLKNIEQGNFKESPIADMYAIANGLHADMDYLFYLQIEDSIEQFYLAYRLSTLPESIQEEIQIKLQDIPDIHND